MKLISRQSEQAFVVTQNFLTNNVTSSFPDTAVGHVGGSGALAGAQPGLGWQRTAGDLVNKFGMVRQTGQPAGTKNLAGKGASDLGVRGIAALLNKSLDLGRVLVAEWKLRSGVAGPVMLSRNFLGQWMMSLSAAENRVPNWR